MDSSIRHKGSTVVIKLGTSSIVDEKTNSPVLSTLSLIVETVAKLRNVGHRVILVSSGAVGVGTYMMDIERDFEHHSYFKALAAVGQCRLMSLWESLFGHLRIPVAQLLLSGNDIAYPMQCDNVKTTFSRLLDMGVVPIINENDTLTDEENKIGDNDTLSAMISAIVKADYLFLMTDVDCLYTQHPQKTPNAEPIEVVADISALTADVSTSGSRLGTGGMSTKISAARLSTSAGVTTIIMKSSKPSNVVEIMQYLEEAQNSHHFESGKKKSNMNHLISLEDNCYSSSSLLPLHTRFIPSAIQSHASWNHLKLRSPKHCRCIEDEKTSSSESSSSC